MISLPYSKNKRYLSGIDWLLYSLGKVNQHSIGVQNSFLLVLDLSDRLCEKHLRAILDLVGSHFPILFGEVRRDFNLAPYWYVPKGIGNKRLTLSVSSVNSDTEALSTLREELNVPFATSNEHVRFHLVVSCGKSFLGVVFDHALFDDRGAEMFLQVIDSYMHNTKEKYPVCLTSSAHLSEWAKKFTSGRSVNRFFRTLAGAGAVALFGTDDSKQPRKNFFRHISFTEERSARILARAEAEAGYMLTMPYLLSRSAIVLNSIKQKRGGGSSDFIVPVTVDCRREKEGFMQLFFNHLSFMFYRFPHSVMNDAMQLTALIKEQMYSQVKTDMPAQFMQTLYLLRIVPVSLFRFLLRLPFANVASSFSFAAILKSSYPALTFCSVPVVNILHFPSVPVDPGVGLYFTKYNGKLNAILSYVEGFLSETEADSVVDLLQEALGD